MINSVCGVRSTGRICTDLAQMLEQLNAMGARARAVYKNLYETDKLISQLETMMAAGCTAEAEE